MKKKFRNITVNGVVYAWHVPKMNRLTIWLNKEVIYNGAYKNDSCITPSLVREFIGNGMPESLSNKSGTSEDTDL